LDGKLDKLKARLIADGFEYKKGIDYEETFAPIVKWNTIQSIVALIVHNK
jgi:hypothetical protein